MGQEFFDGKIIEPGGGIPAPHAISHENGGTDEINVGGLNGVLADAQTPTLHASNHENGGADEINVGGLNGVLADAQTPTLHASTHENGGADSIKLDDLATPDDNTDLNASASRHGLLGKLDGVSTNYLDGSGAWSVPSAGALTNVSNEGSSGSTTSGTYSAKATISLVAGTWMIFGYIETDADYSVQPEPQIRLRNTTDGVTYAEALTDIYYFASGGSASSYKASTLQSAVVVLAGTKSITLELCRFSGTPLGTVYWQRPRLFALKLA